MHNSSRYPAAQWRCASAISTGSAGSGEEHRRGLDVPREEATWVSPVFDDRVAAFLLRQCELLAHCRVGVRPGVQYVRSGRGLDREQYKVVLAPHGESLRDDLNPIDGDGGDDGPVVERLVADPQV